MDHDEADKDNSSNARCRRWYRKRRRDTSFAKQRNSDESQDDSDDASASSGSPQVKPRRRRLSSESNRSSQPSTRRSSGSESRHSGSGESSHPDESGSNEGAEGSGNDGDAAGQGSNEEEPSFETNDAVNENSQDGDEESQASNVEDPLLERNKRENGNRQGPERNPAVDGEPLQDHREFPVASDSSGDDQTGSEASNEHQSQSERDTDSEGGSSHHEDENEHLVNHDDDPIFPGASISFRESLLSILTFALSHKLTGQCISDLLSLIALHCGPNNVCIKTLHKFKTYFEMLGKNVIICHYFCSVCELSLEKKDSICETCNGQHSVSYFIEFPIASQLQSMFARPGFYESLNFKFTRVKKSEANIEDVYDGLMYQQLIDSGFLANQNNLSFFMYFDGISLFKSSSFSIWPVYFSINELKYTLRTKQQNVVLAGLWFGKSKPNPNLFLQPIQASMTVLKTNGVDLSLPTGRNVTVRAKILGAVGDMPAKALFMRMAQFNGAFSCFHCMAQGGRFDLGNASVQVFPYSRNIELRNNDEINEFAQQAVIAHQRDPEATVYGIKGPSLLSVMLPNMILCMAQDIMHGCFLGLMRTLLYLWFDTKNNPFSIADLVHIVDVRLKAIKPPSAFKVPLSISKELALMKAKDLKIFMFYYSLPVLLGILPERYWFHHCKLVTAISLLSQESISPQQINEAEELFHVYVSEFQELYGLRYLSLTCHQLLHLPAVVRNLGPAWVYSCFFYEGLNGQLARLVHGSRHAAMQICSSSSVFMKLPALIDSMRGGSDAKVLCLKFQGRWKPQFKISETIDNESDVVGKMDVCYPVPPACRRLLQETYNINDGRCKYFYRLKKKGTVYCSESYVRSKRKLSCFVLIRQDDCPYLCKINSFIRWSSCHNCPMNCIDCRKMYLCIATVYEKIPWEVHDAPQNVTLGYFDRVTPTNEIRAFPVECIRSICLYLPVDGKHYIAVPVNSLEVE